VRLNATADARQDAANTSTAFPVERRMLPFRAIRLRVAGCGCAYQVLLVHVSFCLLREATCLVTCHVSRGYARSKLDPLLVVPPAPLRFVSLFPLSVTYITCRRRGLERVGTLIACLHGGYYHYLGLERE